MERNDLRMECVRLDEHLTKYCEENGISKEFLRSDSRDINHVTARMGFVASVDGLGFTLSGIGRALHRNHATIIHYMKKLQDLSSEHGAGMRVVRATCGDSKGKKGGGR